MGAGLDCYAKRTNLTYLSARCERVTKPAPANCQVRHQITVSNEISAINTSAAISQTAYCTENRGAYGGLIGGTFRLPDNLGLCLGKEGSAGLEGLQVRAVGLSGVTSYGLGSDMSHQICGGLSLNEMVISFGPVTCNSGIATVSITSMRPVKAGKDWAVNSLSIQVAGFAEKLKITADRWYPEDCVARAQRDR